MTTTAPEQSPDVIIPYVPSLRSTLLSELLEAQATDGYVSDDAIHSIARRLRITVNEIEGVVTGFPDLRRSKPAPHLIQVCTGMSCLCNGAAALLAEAQRQFAGNDELIGVEESHCLFCCGVAPVVAIDGKLIAAPSLGSLGKAIAELARGDDR